MTWYGILALVLIVGGTAAVCAALYGKRGGPVHCIAGEECVLMGKPAEKRETAADFVVDNCKK